MKFKKTFVSCLICASLLCPLLPAMNTDTSAASPFFSENFEVYAINALYPSNKLWSTSAQFKIQKEESSQFLRMSFFETNKDAALIPYTGTITPARGTILACMDLRPVYREGNAESFYDFRVREYTYTDESGNDASGKWKTFFRLVVENENSCYLSDFSLSTEQKLTLVHGAWNTVTVSINLVSGDYTVSVGEQVAHCNLGLKNLGFKGNQLQFNQLVKSCTYATTENAANYVDIDNIRLSPSENVSRFENLFGETASAELRTKDPESELFSAGIRFVTEVDKTLMKELIEMKESGEARSVTVGTLIAPADYLTHTTLTRSLPAHAKLDVQSELPNVYYTYGSERASIAGSIARLKEENLGRDFTARAYVNVLLTSGQSFTVYSNTVTASAKALAQGATETEDASLEALLEECKNAKAYQAAEELRIMSYNVYYSDLREERMQLVADEIKQHMPDIMGLQEVVDGTWKNYLIDALGENYACIGHGRENGATGEGTPIFYRKDKFTLLEEHTYWLSDTPDVCSKYPSSRQSRIFTYALLKRNSDGKTFVLANTHLDTKTPEARQLQTRSLLRQITSLGLDQYPVFITGDMNAVRTSPDHEIDIFLNAGYSDCSDLAISRSAQIAAIDYCFVKKEHATVINYYVDSDAVNGEEASDHDPVIVDIRLK